MSTRPDRTPDHATSTSPGTPHTLDGAGAAAHDPLAPPAPPSRSPHTAPRPSRAPQRHPAVLAGLAAGTLALLTVLIAGVVRGSEDMVSTGVIGLLVTISWATAPWVTARAAAPASTTKEHSRA